MKRAIASRPVAASLALLALCSSGPSARADNDHLIVPWQRIGPVTLGMNAAALIDTLGKPTQTMRGPFVSVYVWNNSLAVYIKTDGSYVTQICALTAAYATAEGVRPGVADHAVTDLLGPPQNSRVYSRWSLLSYTDLFWPGLMVSVPLKGFDNNHAVREVCVNHNA